MTGESSPDCSLDAPLEIARRELLDIGTRNRLIHTPRGSSRSTRLEIVDEISDEVFRHLVVEGKTMSFLPRTKTDEVASGDSGQPSLFDQPEEVEEHDERGKPVRHVDNRLQTSLTSEVLQRRLLRMYHDARAYEEEQGVSILYLALGFLKWYEDEKSDRERFSPLVLVPVELDRKSAGSRFHIRYAYDEITTNLSLQARLQADFNISLPEVPEIEDLSPSDYFDRVSRAIAGQQRWEILPNDIVLWFFSFAKFLMYRDLKPETWPDDSPLGNRPLIGSLLSTGFRNEPPILNDGQSLDELLQPLDLLHVMDADSSQALVIEEVKQGRSLVVQGPPGTGKSQTITNMIAAAIKAGRRVLFVAEKMAALEVVKRRLDNIGLGEMCLELHSHKASKNAVLEQLRRTLLLGRPTGGDVQHHAEDLRFHRDRLNQHATVLHTPLDPTEVTPYRALGELVRLRSEDVPPPDFQLEDPLTWSHTQFQKKRALVEDVALHMSELGNPARHPWRGIRLEAVLPSTIQRLAATLPEVISALDTLIDASNKLASLLHTDPPSDVLCCEQLSKFAEQISAAPPGRECLEQSVWCERQNDIAVLVKHGCMFSKCRTTLDDRVAEVAWSTDVTAARRHLAAYGGSWFRLFRRQYREAMATMRGIVVDVPPKPLDERLQLLDTLIEGRRAHQAICSNSSQQLGKAAFGQLWYDDASDWQAVTALVEWEEASRLKGFPDHFRKVAAETEDLQAMSELAASVGDWKRVLLPIRDLFQELQLNAKWAFGETDLRSIPLTVLRTRLFAWRDDPEGLSRWRNYYIRWKKLREEGLRELAVRLNEGAIGATEARKRMEYAWFEGLIGEAFRRHRELAEFDGLSHEKLLDQFRRLDTERITLAREEVALAHFNGLPTRAGDAGEMGIVRHELNKKRRHKPLRKLLKEAGHAVQAIKPVFMMSPISVAQYLEPGAVEFDLLLIDEASQVRPVEALGAVARARQLVVVGDDKQLPPTRFFDRLTAQEGDDVGDDENVGDLESVLGLCCAKNMSQRMLQWHYRSLHDSLIAVSNREFYDDCLFVIPSPVRDSRHLGLYFQDVPNGVYDRGGSATNRVEARTVADAVIEHARQFPDKTLGVGSFSVAQRDAILDELELLRRQHPELESFFSTGGPEPFFVKNLENIQGDERDVIFISVGYAKDDSGYLTMNFGPLSSDGGERRLNVLITRSRERCVVFSSISADDIDLNRARSRGPKALKVFLSFARTGNLDIGVATSRKFDSEFEQQVARAIADHGYAVDSQIGVAGFFVDLAVRDPDTPGRYVMGIECDGASYHSSRSARDRDRLRQQVLESRRWIIHRIWSTDWFHRPDEQLKKTLAAIEQARAEWSRRDREGELTAESDATGVTVTTVDREAAVDCFESNENSILTEPYREANFTVQTSREIHEHSARELARVVSKIVEIEGPVHQDEIARRVAVIWGLKRTGNRISDAVESALVEAVDRELVTREGPFFSDPRKPKTLTRNREGVKSSQLRRPEMLPPQEIRTALAAVVATHPGITPSEAIVESTRLFGYRSTSSQLRSVIQRHIEPLVSSEAIVLRNGKLYPATSTSSAIHR